MIRRSKHFFEYAVLRLACFLAGMVPWRLIPFLSRPLGFAARAALVSRRRLVLANLRGAFPEWTEEKIRRTAFQFWDNIARTALECLRAFGGEEKWIRENVILDNPEVLEEALKRRKGVLLHSGHFCNWEFSGTRIALAGYPVAALGRTQKNPYVDRWLSAYRRRFGMTVFNHHQAVRETQDWLRKNGCLGILGDHNLYKGGIFIEFLGRPASASTLTALLHLRLESPIVGVYSYRKKGKQHVRFSLLAGQSSCGGGGKERAAMAAGVTQELARETERWVMENPSNWLWGHNRWKRQPLPKDPEESTESA